MKALTADAVPGCRWHRRQWHLLTMIGSSVRRWRTAPQPQPPSILLLVMRSGNAYLGAMTQYITVAADDRVESRNGVIKLHGPEGFEGMRRAGRLAAEILDS